MKRTALHLCILLLAVYATACSPEGNSRSISAVREFTPEEVEEIARCLTEKGWVMYGTSTCSGCRAKRKGFGKAWAHINYIECDPYEENSQADRCVERKIRKTPTWILEVDGKEIKRLELYQLPEDLVLAAGCDPVHAE